MTPKQKFTNILLGTSIILSLSGCGHAAKNFKIADSYKSSLSKDNNLAIITDVCLRVDESGEDTDHFAIYKSKEILTLLDTMFADNLKNSPFSIGYTINDSACAFYKRPSKNVKMVINEDDEIIAGDLPYYLSDEANKEYRAAVQRVLYRSVVSANDKHFSEVFFTDKKILNDLKLIKEVTSQNKLLIVAIKAGEVGATKKFGQSLKSAFLGGKVAVDYLHTYSVLIDMEQNKAIWTTQNIYKYPSLYDQDFYNTDYYSLAFKSLQNR